MKRTDVLHLIDSAGLYGAERVVLTLLSHLKTSEFPGILGYICKHAGSPPEIAQEAARSGLQIQCFEMTRGVDVAGLLKIVRYVEEHNIQIVHSHGYKSNILLGLLLNASFHKISTVHGWSKESASLKGRLYEALDAVAIRRMDKVVAVSRAVKLDLEKRGIHGDEVEVIYNGLSEPPSYMAEKRSNGNGSERASHMCVIGAIGRLVDVKGHEYLLRAMPSVIQEIGSCTLLIAGSGPAKQSLEQLALKLGISDSVTFCGFVGNIREFLDKIDIFVLPSLSEGLPISLLEAMEAGKPVIATSVGGIPEVIMDSKRGVLVPPADNLALVTAITGLYRDPKRMAELGIMGRKVVGESFTAAEMARSYTALYQQVLKEVPQRDASLG